MITKPSKKPFLIPTALLLEGSLAFCAAFRGLDLIFNRVVQVIYTEVYVFGSGNVCLLLDQIKPIGPLVPVN